MCIEQLGIVCIDIEQLGSVHRTVKICLYRYRTVRKCA